LVFSYKSVPEIKENISIVASVTQCEISAESLQYKQELLTEEANSTVQVFSIGKATQPLDKQYYINYADTLITK
jgi:hypothetical protein